MDPKDKLTKEQIVAALSRLNELLHEKGVLGEICMEAPSWVNAGCRKMAIPYFGAKSPDMKAILPQESPAAFRVPNLFVSANALSRA